MDKPQLTSEEIARRCYKQMDLKPWRSPAAKKPEDRKCETVEQFLARGGKITHLAPEDSGYDPGRKAFVIKAETNNNAT